MYIVRRLFRMVWWYWKAPKRVREAVQSVLFCLHDWEVENDWQFTLYFSKETFEGAVGAPVDQPKMTPYIAKESVTYGGDTTTFTWTMEPQYG